MKKADRQKIFDKCNGRCAYCGCELPKGWHVDHLEALHRDSIYDKEKMKFVQTGTCQHPENDYFENYMPSCPSCNITKATLTLEKFRAYIQQTVESLNRNNYAAYKFAKRFGLIQETPKEVKFYFETLIQ
jgi:hypothetical protein